MSQWWGVLDFGRFIVCLILLSAASAVFAEGLDTPRVILIGFSGPLSGASEEIGKSLANAAEMALADINRQRPRLGGQLVQFRLLRRNDANQPETAVNVARELLRAGVVAVIGTAKSSTTEAVWPVYARAGVAMITPAASAARLGRTAMPGFFRMVGNDDKASQNMADYAIHAMKLTRFAVVNSSGLFDREMARAFGDHVTRSGGEVVMRREASFADDMRRIVRDAKASGAEALFVGGPIAYVTMLAQALAQEGGGLRLLTGSNGAVGTTFLIPAGSASNGTVSIESGLPAEALPGWTAFERRYHRRYGLYLNGLALYAYDAASMLAAVMRQADSWAPHVIIEGLHRIQHRGLTGMIAFDADGEPRAPAFTLYEVQNQRWAPLRIIADRPTLPHDLRERVRQLDLRLPAS